MAALFSVDQLYLPAGICLFYVQAVLLKRVLPVPLRYVNSLVLWAITVATAGLAFFVTLIPYFTLRFVSEHLYVRFGCALQWWYLQIWLFMIQHFMEVRVKIYGERIDRASTNLWIANHVTHDWLCIYPTNHFCGTTGNERVVIKNSVAHLPFLGWVMTMLYWPFLARDYARDVRLLKRLFGSYKKGAIPLQVWLFPEGTRPTLDKMEASKRHAIETHRPVWENVMLPRHRGFCVAVESLQGVASHLADTCIAYEGFKDNRLAPFGEFMLYDHDTPHTVHIHMRKVPLAAIPVDEEGRKEWLMNAFQTKEERLAYFHRNGKFEDDLVFHDKRDTTNVVVVVGAFSFIFASWWAMPLIFSGIWALAKVAVAAVWA